MLYDYHIFVAFESLGSSQQIDREMARRKAILRRIARTFKQYPSYVGVHDVEFTHAPADLAKQVIDVVGVVWELTIVRRACREETGPPQRAPRARRKVVSPKPPLMPAGEIRAFLYGAGTLVGEAEGRRAEVPIRHIFRSGATDQQITAVERTLKRPLTPSHRRLLRITDGCSLFADCSRGRERVGTGLILYSVKQLARENERFQRQTGEAVKSTGRLVVGEPAGFGNWIAVDDERTSKLGEPAIIYVDHEGGDADGRLVADSFEDLLRKLKKDPLRVFRKELDASIVYVTKRGRPLELKQYRAD